MSRLVGTGGEVLAQATERVRQLRTVQHPGVLTPAGLGVAEDDRVVVRFPWLDGVDLAELETRRGPLSTGECVWLGVRIAQALERMHACGIAHGDVSPGNVVIAGDKVVLVDTVAGCLDDEYGTVGFRAPEREREGASASGDVFSLGALLRWCVGQDERMAIEAWTAPLIVSDPQTRPPVDVAARALASCAKEQQLVVPVRSELVTAVRARASERTVRIVAGSAQRWRRLGWRVGLGFAVVAALSAMVVAVPRLVDAAKPPGASAAQEPSAVPGEPATSSEPGESATNTEPTPKVAPKGPPSSPIPAVAPATAAVELTEQRFEALAAGDSDQLLATVDEGALADEVAQLSQALASGDVRYDGLEVVVGDVAVVAELPLSAVVHVGYDVSEHVVVTHAGEQRVAAHNQNVELELNWDGAWTVQAARPIP